MKLVAKIETSDGKFYNLYRRGKKEYLEYKEMLRAVIGSASVICHPGETYILGPEGENLYKFYPNRLVKGKFIIFEGDNDINKIKPSKKVYEEVKKVA